MRDLMSRPPVLGITPLTGNDRILLGISDSRYNDISFAHITYPFVSLSYKRTQAHHSYRTHHLGRPIKTCIIGDLEPRSFCWLELLYVIMYDTWG